MVMKFAYIQCQLIAEFGLHHLWRVLHAGELQCTNILPILFLEHTGDTSEIHVLSSCLQCGLNMERYQIIYIQRNFLRHG